MAPAMRTIRSLFGEPALERKRNDMDDNFYAIGRLSTYDDASIAAHFGAVRANSRVLKLFGANEASKHLRESLKARVRLKKSKRRLASTLALATHGESIAPIS